MSKSPRGQAIQNFLKFLNKSEADRALPKAQPKPEPSSDLDEQTLEALKSLSNEG